MATEIQFFDRKGKQEVLTYGGDEYLTTVCEAQEMIAKYGVAIIPGVLGAEECEQMNDGMWSTAEFLTKHLPVPVLRNNRGTYQSIFDLNPKHGGMFQNWSWGHAQYVWDVRSNPRVAKVFEEIYNTTDLIVSFDGVNSGLRPIMPGGGDKGFYQGVHNFHCDQRFAKNSFDCVQTWLTANPTVPGDGTLRVLEGSHLLHAEFRKTFKADIKHADKDWFVLSNTHVQWYKDQGCKDICITCPAGSQVCWDSRTIHAGMTALPTASLPRELQQRHHRNVVYVCMTPASKVDSENRELRKAVFSPGQHRLQMASHWPENMTLFPKIPRYHTGQPPQVPEMPLPVLNERGQALAGLELVQQPSSAQAQLSTAPKPKMDGRIQR